MKNLEIKSRYFRALGDVNRLRIVKYLLKNKECTCICHLSKILKKDQSVIFRHLQVLKNAGIITTKKKNRFLVCCIKDKEELNKCLG
jgi:ArsR family transcriptional regulator